MGFCFTFLLVSLGDCQDTTTVKEIQKSQTEILNEVITSVSKSTISDNKASAINEIVIKIVGSQDIIVDSIKIKQYAKAELINKVAIAEKLTNETTLDTMIKKMTETYLNITNKATGGNRTSVTNSENEVINIIKNKIKTELKSETIVNCIANAVNNTSISIEARNVVFRAIDIEQTSKASATCISNIINDIVSKVTVPIELIEKVKKETAIINTGGYEYVIYLIVSAIVIIILAFFGIRYFTSQPANV